MDEAAVDVGDGVIDLDVVREREPHPVGGDHGIDHCPVGPHDAERPIGLIDTEQHGRGTRSRDLVDRALRDDPPVVDDRDRVGDLLDLIEQVRREHHRPPLADEPPHHRSELEDAARVEAVDRLVENQQLGIGEQAARDAEALAHAERVARNALLGSIGKADPCERAVDPGIGPHVAGRGDHREILAAAEETVEAGLLDDRADARERLGAPRGHGKAEHVHRSARGRGEPEQHADQRRLAGSVRTEIAECAAARDAQVDGIDRDPVAESLCQP